MAKTTLVQNETTPTQLNISALSNAGFATSGTQDGDPIRADDINDFKGFAAAVLNDNGITASGNPDTQGNSQVYQGLNKKFDQIRYKTLAQAIAENAPAGTRYTLTDKDNAPFNVVDSGDAGGYYIAFLSSGRKLRLEDGKKTVFLKWFNAVCDGITDDTASMIAAKEYLYSNGGKGNIIITGPTAIKDFDMDRPYITIDGLEPQFSYDLCDSTTKLTNAAGANYVIMFTHTSPDVTFGASQGSGFRNLLIKGDSEFGVLIGAGATIHSYSSIQGFDYGCCIIDAANANSFDSVSFLGSEKCNFAVTEEEAIPYIYPFITSPTNVSSTSFVMNNCVSRVGKGFGAVVRDGVNVEWSGFKLESNKMGGLYVLRMNNSSLRLLNFESIWFENNYEGYTTGATTYSVADNKMFWTAANTPITWTSADNAGYQFTIDAQTRALGAGGDTFDWTTVVLAAHGQQKGCQIIAGSNFEFKDFWTNGGDTANFIDVKATAEGVHWVDPIEENDPRALVPSLTSANMGVQGAYFKRGVGTARNELGGMYPQVGVFGGPIHFPVGTASKPYHDDPRVLDDYTELNAGQFNMTWRQGAATPFVVSNEVNTLTKIGRQVTIQARATLTVNTIIAGNGDFALTNLPYPIDKAGNVVGTIWIQDAGGGAAKLLTTTALYALNGSFILSVENVFPALAVNDVYNVSVNITYFAAT